MGVLSNVRPVTPAPSSGGSNQTTTNIVKKAVSSGGGVLSNVRPSGPAVSSPIPAPIIKNTLPVIPEESKVPRAGGVGDTIFWDDQLQVATTRNTGIPLNYDPQYGRLTQAQTPAVVPSVWRGESTVDVDGVATPIHTSAPKFSTELKEGEPLYLDQASNVITNINTGRQLFHDGKGGYTIESRTKDGVLRKPYTYQPVVSNKVLEPEMVKVPDILSGFNPGKYKASDAGVYDIMAKPTGSSTVMVEGKYGTPTVLDLNEYAGLQKLDYYSSGWQRGFISSIMENSGLDHLAKAVTNWTAGAIQTVKSVFTKEDKTVLTSDEGDILPPTEVERYRLTGRTPIEVDKKEFFDKKAQENFALAKQSMQLLASTTQEQKGKSLYDIVREDRVTYDQAQVLKQQAFEELNRGEVAKSVETFKQTFTMESEAGGKSGFNDKFFAYSWAYHPERKDQFIEAVAVATTQLGRELTDVEMYNIRDQYIDWYSEMAGDVVFDIMNVISVKPVVNIALRGGKKAASVLGKVPVLEDMGKFLGKQSMLAQGTSMSRQVFGLVSKLDIYKDTESLIDSFSKFVKMVADNPTVEGLAKVTSDPEISAALGPKHINHLYRIATQMSDSKLLNPAEIGKTLRAWKEDLFQLHLQRLIDEDNRGNITKMRKMVKDLMKDPNIKEIDAIRATAKNYLGIDPNRLAELEKEARNLTEIPDKYFYDKVADEFRKEFLRKNAVIEGTYITSDDLLYNMMKFKGMNETEMGKNALVLYSKTKNKLREAWVTAVLAARPAWVMRNYIDSSFRYILFGGGNIFESLHDVFDLTGKHWELAKKMRVMETDITQTFMGKSLAGYDTGFIQDVMSGEAKITPLPFLDWASIFGREFRKGMRSKTPVAAMEMAKNPFWASLKNVPKISWEAWTKSWNDYNALIEFNLRMRMFTRTFMNNYSILTGTSKPKVIEALRAKGLTDDMISFAMKAYNEITDPQELKNLFTNIGIKNVSSNDVKQYLLMPDEAIAIFGSLQKSDRDNFRRWAVKQLGRYLDYLDTAKRDAIDAAKGTGKIHILGKEKDELLKQVDEAKKQIGLLKTNLNKKVKARAGLLDQLTTEEGVVKSLKGKTDETSRSVLQAYKDKVADLKRRIAVLDKEIEDLLKSFKVLSQEDMVRIDARIKEIDVAIPELQNAGENLDLSKYEFNEENKNIFISKILEELEDKMKMSTTPDGRSARAGHAAQMRNATDGITIPQKPGPGVIPNLRKKKGMTTFKDMDFKINADQARRNLRNADRSIDVTTYFEKASGTSFKVQEADPGVIAKGVEAGKTPLKLRDTTSPEFQRWSTWDWIKNKPGKRPNVVVDKDGKPITLYHLTDQSKFSGIKSHTKDEIGFHLGTTTQVNKMAEIYDPKYVSNIMPVHVSMSNPLIMRRDPAIFDPRTVGHFLTLDERKEIKELGQKIIDIDAKFVDPNGLYPESITDERAKAFIEALEDAGYDGIKYPNAHEGPVDDLTGEPLEFSYMVWKPEQVRSVFNKGAWDPKSSKLVEPLGKQGRIVGTDMYSITTGLGSPTISINPKLLAKSANEVRTTLLQAMAEMIGVTNEERLIASKIFEPDPIYKTLKDVISVFIQDPDKLKDRPALLKAVTEIFEKKSDYRWIVASLEKKNVMKYIDVEKVDDHLVEYFRKQLGKSKEEADNFVKGLSEGYHAAGRFQAGKSVEWWQESQNFLDRIDSHLALSVAERVKKEDTSRDIIKLFRENLNNQREQVQRAISETRDVINESFADIQRREVIFGRMNNFEAKLHEWDGKNLVKFFMDMDVDEADAKRLAKGQVGEKVILLKNDTLKYFGTINDYLKRINAYLEEPLMVSSELGKGNFIDTDYGEKLASIRKRLNESTKYSVERTELLAKYMDELDAFVNGKGSSIKTYIEKVIAPLRVAGKHGTDILAENIDLSEIHTKTIIKELKKALNLIDKRITDTPLLTKSEQREAISNIRAVFRSNKESRAVVERAFDELLTLADRVDKDLITPVRNEIENLVKVLDTEVFDVYKFRNKMEEAKTLVKQMSDATISDTDINTLTMKLANLLMEMQEPSSIPQNLKNTVKAYSFFEQSRSMHARAFDEFRKWIVESKSSWDDYDVAVTYVRRKWAKYQDEMVKTMQDFMANPGTFDMKKFDKHFSLQEVWKHLGINVELKNGVVRHVKLDLSDGKPTLAMMRQFDFFFNAHMRKFEEAALGPYAVTDGKRGILDVIFTQVPYTRDLVNRFYNGKVSMKELDRAFDPKGLIKKNRYIDETILKRDPDIVQSIRTKYVQPVDRIKDEVAVSSIRMEVNNMRQDITDHLDSFPKSEGGDRKWLAEIQKEVSWIDEEIIKNLNVGKKESAPYKLLKTLSYIYDPEGISKGDLSTNLINALRNQIAFNLEHGVKSGDDMLRLPNPTVLGEIGYEQDHIAKVVNNIKAKGVSEASFTAADEILEDKELLWQTILSAMRYGEGSNERNLLDMFGNVAKNPHEFKQWLDQSIKALREEGTAEPGVINAYEMMMGYVDDFLSVHSKNTEEQLIGKVMTQIDRIRSSPGARLPSMLPIDKLPDGHKTWFFGNMDAAARNANIKQAVEDWSKYLSKSLQDGVLKPIDPEQARLLSEMGDEIAKIKNTIVDISSNGFVKNKKEIAEKTLGVTLKDDLSAKWVSIPDPDFTGKMKDVWMPLSEQDKFVIKNLDDQIANQSQYKQFANSMKGALPETNRVMIDYGDGTRMDEWIKDFVPFWSFTKASVPFWAQSIAEDPRILTYYYRYLAASRRISYDQGATTTDGRQLPSMEGYMPLTGTGVWWNPTAALSFRYLIPKGTYYWDDVPTNSIMEKVFTHLYEAGNILGVSLSPWMTIFANTMGWTGKKYPMNAIVPQVDLIPPFWRRAMFERMGKVIGQNDWAEKNLFGEEVPWQDYLIERQIYATLLDEMSKVDTQEKKELRIFEYEKAIREREGNELWDKIKRDMEKDQTYRNWVGYFTGIYAKDFSDITAKANALRDEIEYLKNAVNNQAGAIYFNLDPEAEDRYNSGYVDMRYGKPEGQLYNLFQLSRYTQAEDGTTLRGEERRDYLNDQLYLEQRQTEYYDLKMAEREKFQRRLSRVPIGAPYNLTENIYQDYAEAINRIDTEYKDVNKDWYIGYKPEELILEHYKDRLFKNIESALPEWDVMNDETYPAYLERLAAWKEKEFPMMIDYLVKGMEETLLAELNLNRTDPRTQALMEELPEKFDLYGNREMSIQNLLAKLKESTSIEAYDEWKNKKKGSLQSLEEAWEALYWDPYWETLRDKDSFGMEAAKREFFETYEKPTEDELIAWVMKTYPNKYMEEDLRKYFVMDEGRDVWAEDRFGELQQRGTTITEGSERKILSIQERQKLEGGEQGQLEQDVWYTILMAGPYKQQLTDAYADIVKNDNKAIGDFAIFYEQGANWDDPQNFQAFYQNLQQAARNLNLTSPTNAQLTEWQAAKQANDRWYEYRDQILGPDIMNIMVPYYENPFQQSKMRKQEPRIQEYLDLHDAYAQNNPVWAKYYTYQGREAAKNNTGIVSMLQ